MKRLHEYQPLLFEIRNLKFNRSQKPRALRKKGTMNIYTIIEPEDGWYGIYRNGKLLDEGRSSMVMVFLRSLNYHLDEQEQKGFTPQTAAYPERLEDFRE